MYMKNSKLFHSLMMGNIVTFTRYELWSILTNQNELGINTIAIQQANNGDYVCFVDNNTINRYKEMREV